MAAYEHVSTSMRMTLNAGTSASGKTITKTDSVGKLSSTASASALSDLAEKIGTMLEYPIASVKKYDTFTIVGD